LIDAGPRPELRWLPVDRLSVDRLSVDHAYQRTIESRASQRLIERIAANFSWAKFQAILAAPSASEWKILDGQHRTEGARRCGITEVPAVVIASAELAEQAAAFVGANRDRVAVNKYALYHARLVAGDAEALAVAELAAAVGVAIPRYPIPQDSIKPGVTLALDAFARLPKKHGAAIARLAIGAVADAYRSEPGGLRALFFDAAAQIIAERPPHAKTVAALVPALRRTTAAALDDEIHARKLRVGGTLRSAAIAVIGLRLVKAGPATPVSAATPAPKSAPAATPAAAAKQPRAPLPKPQPALFGRLREQDKRAAMRAGAAADAEAIARHLAEKGVTHVPPAYVAESQAHVGDAEAKRRIKKLEVKPTPPARNPFSSAPP
jgi:hypothetical protein